MMRVLAAEESLRHVTEIALGNGLIKRGEREPILQAWRRDARMAHRSTGKQTLDSLLAPGLPLVRVRRGADGQLQEVSGV